MIALWTSSRKAKWNWEALCPLPEKKLEGFGPKCGLKWIFRATTAGASVEEAHSLSLRKFPAEQWSCWAATCIGPVEKERSERLPQRVLGGSSRKRLYWCTAPNPSSWLHFSWAGLKSAWLGNFHNCNCSRYLARNNLLIFGLVSVMVGKACLVNGGRSMWLGHISAGQKAEKMNQKQGRL